MNYRVLWEIDIEADSPVAAAEAAFSMMGDDSTATNFTVEGKNSRHEVDLRFDEQIALVVDLNSEKLTTKRVPI